LRAVPRPLVWSLYAMLVLIWSSTWVAIKIGLDDVPPLLSAGIRFGIAGAGLLMLGRALRRPLRTDGTLAATMALLPFAAAYGLIYWGEQYVPSGLAAVLFGVMPLYSALIASVFLADEPLRPRLLAGIAVAIGGLALAFSESVALGDARWAVLAATACAVAPLASAIGNVAIKRRGHRLDAIVLNGWAMLGGGALLLLTSALAEDWGQAVFSDKAIGSIAYLAAIGSAVPFVTLTVLLRELPAVTMSYITLLLPFGALVFGAALYDERITAAAIAGAVLVAGGLAVAAR
jgi:drug/metabolite transporter (DMT)-like permease